MVFGSTVGADDASRSWPPYALAAAPTSVAIQDFDDLDPAGPQPRQESGRRFRGGAQTHPAQDNRHLDAG
jgi:hypothetical protein